MTVKEEILEAVELFPGMTDTELEKRCHRTHQTINQACRKLAAEGKLIRRKNPQRDGLIGNFPVLMKSAEPCEQSMLTRLRELMEYIEDISGKLGKAISGEDYYIEDLGCPHKAGKLPVGYCAVYIFEYRGEILKVGKANDNSRARFESQHYGTSAPSTLAKSMCRDGEFIAKGITRQNVGQWMKMNLHRYNIFVKKEDGKAATELIETVLHYALRPRYEGAIR